MVTDMKKLIKQELFSRFTPNGHVEEKNGRQKKLNLCFRDQLVEDATHWVG